MSTRYYIDFICEKTLSGIESYYQLTRRSDEAILYANSNLDNIFLHCFHVGISKDDITLL